MRDLPAARAQFAYHPATPETAPKHAAVRDAYRAFLDQLWEIVPDGPEKTLAIRALQESQMYSNLAIALTAPADEGETRGVARVLPLERNEAAHRAEPIVTLPVVVRIDNRQVLVRPGTWSVPELRQALSVSFGWDLWFIDWHNTRVPLSHSETVTVHDGQRFVTTSRKVARADDAS